MKYLGSGKFCNWWKGKKLNYEWIRQIQKLGVCASKTQRTCQQETEFHKRLNNLLQIKPDYSSYSSGIISWSQVELEGFRNFYK